MLQNFMKGCIPMQNRRKKSDAEVRRQIERARRIYSDIGQPLAADVIVELYRHLGAAMDMVSSVTGGRQNGRAAQRRGLKS